MNHYKRLVALHSSEAVVLATSLVLETTDKEPTTLKSLVSSHGDGSDIGGRTSDGTAISRVFDRALQTLRKQKKITVTEPPTLPEGIVVGDTVLCDPCCFNREQEATEELPDYPRTITRKA